MRIKRHLRNFLKKSRIYIIILFVITSVIYGYITEKRSNTGFVTEIASEEEMAQYNDTGNRIIDGRININAADLEEMVSLPGIGEKTAQAIIDYRSQNGPFKRVEDITFVHGIGTKTLEKIRDSICAD